jgi:hypothetical protein
MMNRGGNYKGNQNFGKRLMAMIVLLFQSDSSSIQLYINKEREKKRFFT